MGASHYCCHSWWHLTVWCIVAFISLQPLILFVWLIVWTWHNGFFQNYCCGVFLHKDRWVNLHPLGNNPQFLWWFFAKFTKLFLTKSWKQCVFCQCEAWLFKQKVVIFVRSKWEGKKQWSWCQNTIWVVLTWKMNKGVCHTVALPFTLKSIRRQKKNYGNSNISTCKNIIFKKSSKRNQKPSRYCNSIQ